MTMRAPVDDGDTDAAPLAPRVPEAERRPWKAPTRVTFAFDPWRGGFGLSVERPVHRGGYDEGEDGPVRWRTAASRAGTPVVIHVEHVARGSGSTAYVVNKSDVGLDVPLPVVRLVDGMVIVRASKVPAGELVMVELCDGLVTVAGVWSERADTRSTLHVSTLKAHTGTLGSTRVDVRVEELKHPGI
jgi:hypothetical protein